MNVQLFVILIVLMLDVIMQSVSAPLKNSSGLAGDVGLTIPIAFKAYFVWLITL